MTDLSRVRNQGNVQARPILRRGSLFPRADGPFDSPSRRIATDMRAARRAQPNADAILDLARQVNGTFNQIQDQKLEQFIFDEENNAFKAVEDAATGAFDPELAEKSRAYTIAHNETLARAALATGQTKATQAIQELVNNFEGVDVELALQGADALIAESILSTITDAEGNTIDMGSARATALAANRVGAVAAELREKAELALESKAKANFKDANVNSLVAQVRAGETVDTGEIVKSLRDFGLTDLETEKGLLEALSVIASEDPAMAEEIAAIWLGIPNDVASARGVRVRGEGEAPPVTVPEGFQMTAAGMAQLSDVREQAGEKRRTLALRAEQERHEATADKILEGIMDNRWPTASELKELAQSGQLGWQQARNFVNMREAHIRGLQADADRAEARAMRRQNAAAAEFTAMTALQFRRGDGPMTRGEFDQWFGSNMGQMGEGTSLLSNYMTAFSAFREGIEGPTRDPEYKLTSKLLKDALNPTSTTRSVERLRSGNLMADSQRTTMVLEQHRINVVKNGMSPMESLADISAKNKLVSGDLNRAIEDHRNQRLSELKARRAEALGQ